VASITLSVGPSALALLADDGVRHVLLQVADPLRPEERHRVLLGVVDRPDQVRGRPLPARRRKGVIQLELLTGPLTGIYDPNGMGAMFSPLPGRSSATTSERRPSKARSSPHPGRRGGRRRPAATAQARPARRPAHPQGDRPPRTAPNPAPPAPSSGKPTQVLPHFLITGLTARRAVGEEAPINLAARRPTRVRLTPEG
jgi:hypothetical protein